MIIICPNCSSRYQMPADAIGEGRKVKCKSCQHIWFQAPIDVHQATESTQDTEARNSARNTQTEKSFEQSLSAEDVPRAIRPDQAAESDLGITPAKASKDDSASKSITIPLYSAGGVAALFILCLFVLFGFRHSLVHAQPGMNGFYALFGAKVSLPGTDLVFDRLSHSVLADGTTLRISGSLINLSEKKRQTANIELIPLDENGIILEDPLVFSLPKTYIDGEAQRGFLLDYTNYPESLRDIELALTLEKAGFEGRLVDEALSTAITQEPEIIIHEGTHENTEQTDIARPVVNPHQLRLITDEKATPPPHEDQGAVMQFHIHEDAH